VCSTLGALFCRRRHFASTNISWDTSAGYGWVGFACSA
jgi:hypothetical protein